MTHEERQEIAKKIIELATAEMMKTKGATTSDLLSILAIAVTGTASGIAPLMGYTPQQMIDNTFAEASRMAAAMPRFN